MMEFISISGGIRQNYRIEGHAVDIAHFLLSIVATRVISGVFKIRT